MTYPSKIDPWLAAVLLVLAGGGLAEFGISIWMWVGSRGPAAPLFFSAVCIVLVLTLLVWPVRYTLEERDLIVRFGAVRVRISYKDIQEVSPSRVLWSAPALSLDRLAIRYRGGWTLISPLHKERFLQELAGRDVDFVLTGDRIVRR